MKRPGPVRDDFGTSQDYEFKRLVRRVEELTSDVETLALALGDAVRGANMAAALWTEARKVRPCDCHKQGRNA